MTITFFLWKCVIWYNSCTINYRLNALCTIIYLVKSIVWGTCCMCSCISMDINVVCSISWTFYSSIITSSIATPPFIYLGTTNCTSIVCSFVHAWNWSMFDPMKLFSIQSYRRKFINKLWIRFPICFEFPLVAFFICFMFIK